MPAAREHRMVLQSRFEEVAKAEEAVMELLQGHGYGETAQFAVRLSLEEALTNAIKHGNHFDPTKQVVLTFTVDGKQAVFTVRDEGEGFAPGHVPDPTRHENLEKPHGRGIMLIRAYMTEAHYSDCGRCLTMVKRRDCRLPDQT